MPFAYTSFHTAAAMRTAYNRDVSRSQTKPVPNGTCAKANFEAVYTIDGQPGGRLQCREHTSTANLRYRDMMWTNDELLVIGYLSSRIATWQELIDF